MHGPKPTTVDFFTMFSLTVLRALVVVHDQNYEKESSTLFSNAFPYFISWFTFIYQRKSVHEFNV